MTPTPSDAQPVAMDLRTLVLGFRLDWSGLRQTFEEFASHLEGADTYELRSACLDEIARRVEDAVTAALDAANQRTDAERQKREAAERERDEAKDEGVNFVFDHLAIALGLSHWNAEDGSETWDGDVCATLMRILRDSRAIDPETDTLAADAAEAAEASLAKANARIAELKAALRPFAEQADEYDACCGDLAMDDDQADWPSFQVADFRRARAALTNIEKERDDEA